jgi:internalin A
MIRTLSKNAREQIKAVRQGLSNEITILEALTEFPHEIRRLSGLERLTLRDLDLRTVPDWIRELPNLGYLDLRFNPIERVPDVPGLMLEWSSYSRLQNELTPRNIIGIHLCTEAEGIPSALRHLTSLRDLWVTGDLQMLPKWLPEFRHLTVLAFSNHQFSEIPEELFRIPSLERLYLSCAGIPGQLKEIPRSILEAANLRELHLAGHDIQTPPHEIVSKGVKAIKSYWRQLKQ